jgi:DNA repair exonuclease SbcCD ATPase subunit
MQIEGLNESLLDLTKKSQSVSEKSNLVFDKMNKLTKTKNEHNYKIKDCEKDLKLYDNDSCPTCGSDLNDDIHKKHQESIKDNKIALENKLEETKKSIDELKKVNVKIDNKKRELNESIYDIRLSLDQMKSTQKTLSKPKESTSEFDTILENTIKSIDTILTTIEDNKKNEYLYTELSKIFGEDGVKLQIMKNFLPSFNKSINEIGMKLHFPYKIEIDEKFNSKLLSIGEEINPKTLSTGERKKADFAVLISLIHIMKRNYPNINLLFLDEILASIDSYGVYEMLSLIRTIVDELDLTVFVINHSELPKEMFDYVYAVNKVAGFSELEVNPC